MDDRDKRYREKEDELSAPDKKYNPIEENE